MISSTTFFRNLSKNTLKNLFGPLHGNSRSTTSAHENTKYSCIQDDGTHRRPFPPDHIVDLEEAAMGWVLRLTLIRSI